MGKVVNSIADAMELVEKMLKGGDYFNGEWFEENCGEAYLDWGVVDDFYTNVSCKWIADSVGMEFQKRGYYVYYQVMGWTKSGRIPEGTPMNIRIKKEPKSSGSSLVPFN